jgi:hypothetical protein
MPVRATAGNCHAYPAVWRRSCGDPLDLESTPPRAQRLAAGARLDGGETVVARTGAGRKGDRSGSFPPYG